MKTVNSTKKKEKETTTFIFIGITDKDTTFYVYRYQGKLSSTTALQKPEIYRNP